jgi:hypothetical protein
VSFLEKLFDNGEGPLTSVEDSRLGLMMWSKDDEAWIGTYNGLRFALAYDRKAAPTARLLSYAKEMLGDPEWLASTLEEEKKKWAAKVPPSVKDEVATLRFGLIYFSMRKERGYVIADVEGGGDNRSWRIEFIDRKCAGLGFDT